MENTKIRDRLWDEASRKKIPLTGAFELLPVCNLSCRMCYVRKSMEQVRAEGGLSDGKFWLEIAEQAAACGLLYPLLTGGEPFLHPDIREIIAGMQAMGMQISINSNGTMIDRDTAAWLGRHRPSRISITLYGACEEDYARLCGDGAAFGRVRNAVALCQANGVPLKFNVSLTPENCASLPAIEQYAKDVGVHLDAAVYMFPPIRRDAAQIGQNDRLPPAQAAALQLRRNRATQPPQLFAASAARFREFCDPERCAPRAGGAAELPFYCHAGRSSFWIDWKGVLSGCGIYSPFAYPLRELPFAEAWRRLVEETERYRYHPACADCPNVRFCSPCPAKLMAECGSTDGRPEYLCRLFSETAALYRKFEQEEAAT